VNSTSVSAFALALKRSLETRIRATNFNFSHDAPNRQCNSTALRLAWHPAETDCGVHLLLILAIRRLRRRIEDGSIKNWPSTVRCCLGGVRGTGQSVRDNSRELEFEQCHRASVGR